ncbi:MAG: hypothetical protein M1546_05490 [Chloroflexi bacterium]|nr:hypothetical protein [Chloroflexota bacterium]
MGDETISTASEAVPDELIEGQWRKGTWNGIEMLSCVRCQWDTLEGIEAARARKAGCPHCRPPEPPAPASSSIVLVADRWGNERTEGQG